MRRRVASRAVSDSPHGPGLALYTLPQAASSNSRSVEGLSRPISVQNSATTRPNQGSSRPAFKEFIPPTRHDPPRQSPPSSLSVPLDPLPSRPSDSISDTRQIRNEIPNVFDSVDPRVIQEPRPRASAVKSTYKVPQQVQQQDIVIPSGSYVDAWSAAESEDLYGNWRPPAIQERLKRQGQFVI